MDYPNMICFTNGISPIGMCVAHNRPLHDCRRMYEKSEAEKENEILRAEVKRLEEALLWSLIKVDSIKDKATALSRWLTGEEG
jgi:hypothetical protein